MGVSKQAVSQYLKNNPDVKELCEIENDRIYDISENVVDHDITNNRSVDTAKWKLTHTKKGKERGYGNRQELEVEHSGSVGILSLEEFKKEIEEIRKNPKK